MQQRLVFLQQVIERAAHPAVVAVLRPAIFGERRRLLVAVPAEDAAFMDRMQRVDEHAAARNGYTQGRQLLAEFRDQIGFGHAGEPGFGDPDAQRLELRVVHAVSIARRRARPTSHFEGAFQKRFQVFQLRRRASPSEPMVAPRLFWHSRP